MFSLSQLSCFLVEPWRASTAAHSLFLSLSLSLSLPPSSLELHLNLETHVLSMQGVSLQSSVWDLWWLTGNFSVHVKGAFFKREKSELERTRTLIKSCDLKRGGGEDSSVIETHIINSKLLFVNEGICLLANVIKSDELAYYCPHTQTLTLLPCPAAPPAPTQVALLCHRWDRGRRERGREREREAEPPACGIL